MKQLNTPAAACFPRFRRGLMLLAAVSCLAGVLPVMAEETAASSSVEAGVIPPKPQRDFRCNSLGSLPPNPNKLYYQCTKAPFDADNETLTRTWNGIRNEIKELGITPTASLTTQLLTNASGPGPQRYIAAGTLAMSINWDFDKLFKVPGLSLYVGTSQSFGRALSNYIGNLFPVDTAYSGTGFNLNQMYLQEQMLDQNLILSVGRLAPANTFATIPVFSNYMNDGINSFPGSIGVNELAFAGSPIGVEWGVQALYTIIPEIQVGGGVYTTNQNAANGVNHGVDFDLNLKNGVLTIAQINYLRNQTANAVGLPGQYSLGFYYDSSSFATLNANSYNKYGNFGIYAMAQQMVYREGGPGSQQGLTLWGSVTVNPEQKLNIMPWFLGGGASYQGLIPKRPNDITSVGMIYGPVSKYVAGAAGETVIEVNHQIALTSWFTLTPDFQYIFRPNGGPSSADTAVFGFVSTISF